MPSDATGHHPDTRPKHVQIDEALWRECQAVIPKVKPDRLPAMVGTIDGNVQVWLVDGDYIKITHDMDYCEGSNGLADPDVCGRNQIILDDNIELHDLAPILFHEANERRKMLTGWKYDRAHVFANDCERVVRKRLYASEKGGVPQPAGS